MRENVLYLNLIKFLTMAFVLGFTAYLAKANEVILDIDPFPACIECMPETADMPPQNLTPENMPGQSLQSDNLPKISLGNGVISMAVLNPDLTDFDSVRLAVVEIADLEIAAEYSSYALKDINHDDKTDLVFYFSTRDLIPSHPEADTIAHDACLFVDILNTNQTISNYSLCENAFFVAQGEI